MNRVEATELILEAKKEKGLTWKELAEKVEMSDVWTTAALMGQVYMNEEEAAKATDALGLGPEVAEALQNYPMRGGLDPLVPTDPLVYRFYEIMQVYGVPMKQLIHEEFGDGIMSAIDLTVDVEREEDSDGDRVKITYSGKFLPYKKW
ncbi:MAG: cyanase [Rubrobacteraceae bacterium]